MPSPGIQASTEFSRVTGTAERAGSAVPQFFWVSEIVS
jgi:hypothetical protein